MLRSPRHPWSPGHPVTGAVGSTVQTAMLENRISIAERNTKRMNAAITSRFVSRLTRETLALILAGGRGSRLKQLTLWRGTNRT